MGLRALRNISEAPELGRILKVVMLVLVVPVVLLMLVVLVLVVLPLVFYELVVLLVLVALVVDQTLLVTSITAARDLTSWDHNASDGTSAVTCSLLLPCC